MTSNTFSAPAAEALETAGAVLNLSCYKFTPLERLAEMRQELQHACRQLQIRGTILLSPEGINFFVAGPPDTIRQLVAQLRSYPGLSDIQPKESYSDHQPFSRMLVRLKKEIIAFGVEGIDPAAYTSRKLPARTLKAWLDNGRPVTLLDVRNNYEIEVGTFDQALPINIDHFRDFPAAAERLPPQTKDQPIVMFCTGGIRCEKAGPMMERLGFREIYQLDGGILKYFEEVGGEHWHGECFVFDKRVSLDPQLAETATTQCYACQHPLTPADQASAHYIAGRQCPYCFNVVADRERRQREARQAALRRFADCLPGSQPYDNLRPLNVPQRYAGCTLLDFVDQLHPHIGRQSWAEIIATGRVRLGRRPIPADWIVKEGMGLQHLVPNTIEPDVEAHVEILFEDANLVVVNKPAPLPVHPCGRFNRNTLDWMLQQVYRPQRLKLVHRLDADTSGLMVVARHRRAATKLQELFQTNQVEKVYLARVHGHPAHDNFSCQAGIGTEPGEQGLRRLDPAGLPAETHFRVRERFGDGTSLIEATPVTGRTNQIRLHLWDLGWPVLGDPAYLPQRKLGQIACGPLGQRPLCLHAWRLRFANPFPAGATAAQIDYRWETPSPPWGETTWSPTTGSPTTGSPTTGGTRPQDSRGEVNVPGPDGNGPDVAAEATGRESMKARWAR